MNPRFRAWLLILIVAIVCTVVTGGVIWQRSRLLTTGQLLKRMPSIDALVVFIDFEKLREAGLVQMLYGSKADEDPEYRDFVLKTDFHWSQDLDSALLAVAPSGKYLVARGRFDWNSLRNYVKTEAGSCYNTLCKMRGSAPERHISFLPLQTNVMAMAVSTDDEAAYRLSNSASGPDLKTPDAPIWMTIPASVLRSQDLPDGTVSFARSVADADSVTLMFVPEPQRLAAKLIVVCRTSDDADRVSAELKKLTEVLRSLIAHAHVEPSPSDTAAVLAAGSFQTQGRKVFGYWPIEPQFLKNILSAR